MTARFRIVFLATLIAVSGCKTGEEPKPDPTTMKSSAPLVVAPPGLRFVKIGAGPDASPLIKAEADKAQAEGRSAVVYIGASKWCEPCQRFHEAAKKGELDKEFPKLNVIEFDLDEDRDRIVKAGYTSTLIPLFVIPGPDGRATDKRFEGGVKGDRAVADLTRKLHKLFD
jgi:thiol-disulfide isomerase/thioredoxin